MCFTETYLSQESNIDYFLNRYNYIASRRDVSKTNHGECHGIVVCSRKALTVEKLLFCVEGLESHAVLVKTHGYSLIVVVVYRPPSKSMLRFVELLESLIQMMPPSIPTVVLGDFNQDLLEKHVSPLMRLMLFYEFHQFVQRPTTDMGTLLDHIYFKTGPSKENTVVDVVDTYYSDHDATFLTIKY
jgi:hypothetical protein